MTRMSTQVRCKAFAPRSIGGDVCKFCAEPRQAHPRFFNVPDAHPPSVPELNKVVALQSFIEGAARLVQQISLTPDVPLEIQIANDELIELMQSSGFDP